jgi:hypothetical protein
MLIYLNIVGYLNIVARAATIRDGVWIVNWIYWITIQYIQSQCKHSVANSQLSPSDVLSGCNHSYGIPCHH